MKKIEAFIKPFTLEAIKAALANASIEIFRIYDAQELNTVSTYTDVYRGTSYEMDAIPRIVIVIFAQEGDVDRIVELIQEAGQTEHLGDGSIIVSSVEQIVMVNQKDPEPQ